MAHPYQEHRAVKKSHDRVSHIVGKAAGGSASGHSDAAEDRKLIAKVVKASALKAEGGGVKPRLDRKNGGAVKKSKGTTVNVIVSAPGGVEKPTPALTPPVSPPPGPAMPPKPPMAGPPGLPPGAGGPPPGIPMRARGGKVKKAEGGSVPLPKPRPQGKEPQPSDLYSPKQTKALESRAKGGKVAFPVPKGSISADADDVGAAKGRTQVKHTNEKADEKPNLNRKPVITKATGGAIYSDGKIGKQMAPTCGTGAGGGKSRLWKEHKSK